MHDPRARLCRFRVRTFRRRWDQRLDKLMSEADDLVRAHVATDHAVGQPGLEWLIDDTALVREIGFAPVHEIAELHMLGHAATGRMQHLNGFAASRGFGCELDLPHAFAAVASVLFEHSRDRRSQALRKLFAERCGAAIQVGVRAPAEMPGAVKNFLHAHLEDHIRMGTDPYAFRRHVPQQRVEHNPVLSRKKRIDPDQDTVTAEKLFTHLIGHVIGIERGLRLDAERGHRFENAMQSIVLWRRRMPFRDVPGPE